MFCRCLFDTGCAADESRHIFFVDCRIAVYVHGAEFKKCELLSVLPEPHLAKEHRTLRCQLDSNRYEQEYGQAKNQRYDTAGNVHQPLRAQRERLSAVFASKRKLQSRSDRTIG